MKKFFCAAFIFLCFGIFFQVHAEVSEKPLTIDNYPDQGSYINTLRFEYFRMPCTKTFWAEMSLWKYSFYSDGTEYSVAVLNGKDQPEMEYKAWVQKSAKSKLAVILPGMGGHFSSASMTQMANILYTNGYTVIALNSAMHPDFMESAASAVVPGYTPFDAKDVYEAAKKAISDLQQRKKDKQFTEKLLVGISLGALHALFVSDIEMFNNSAVFDRYIAVNPPVDMLYSLERLEEVYDVWELWNRDEFNQRIDWITGIYLGMVRNKIPSNAYIPLHEDEAKFLIGKSYHIVLKSMIYSINKRKDFGFLKAKATWFSREALYKEIEKFSYVEFRDTFIKKYYEEVFSGKVSMEQLNAESGLHYIEKTLSANEKVRVIHNEDDFLLRSCDREWLKNTFKDRLFFYPRGGHLGNLCTKDVQDKIIELLK